MKVIMIGPGHAYVSGGVFWWRRWAEVVVRKHSDGTPSRCHSNHTIGHRCWEYVVTGNSLTCTQEKMLDSIEAFSLHADDLAVPASARLILHEKRYKILAAASVKG